MATKGAAGFDLVSIEDITINSSEVTKVRTGLILEIPLGWEGQIRPRSGLSIQGVFVANTPGTIDADFRSEVKVLLRYIPTMIDDEIPFDMSFPKGSRIAQMVFSEVPTTVEFEEVNELSTTERGEGGFGSTGL